MSKLNTESIKLLDKVYNLRGEDSTILVQMNKEMNDAANTYEETSSIRNELEENIQRLNNEVETLSDEGEKLRNVLAGINENEYANVLHALKIDFHPDDVKAQLESLLPITVNSLVSDIKMSSNELSRVEAKLDETKTEMEELNIRKEEALVNQNRLNHYFDLALDSNINATRDELTNLFEGFDFSNDEARECAKLLMFPEDGLFEYEKEYKFTANERMNEVESPEEDYTNYNFEDDFVLENIDNGEEPITFIEPEEEIINNEIVETTVPEEEKEGIVEIENEQPEDIQVIEEEKTEVTKDEVISYLTELGFDSLDFTSNDIDKIVDNFDKEIITNNVNTVKELGINLDVFADNIELLYDNEMKSKIDKLTSVGKLPQDIYLNPSVLTKYNLSELDSAIKTLEDSGLEPKNVPLMAY